MTPVIRSIRQLAATGLIEDGSAALDEVAARFSVAITPAMTALIDPADPHDPIAAQFVPTAFELDQAAEERADPIGDAAFSPLPGIVHRHADRVLLMPTHACPVYCRFCFRRETVGPGQRGPSTDDLDRALDYIAADPGIWEVIVTGGDPLALSPRRIARMMGRLRGIDHVAVVRFHSRVPVVRPELVDAAMVEALRIGKATYVVLHTNHARELTPTARAACARLVDAGIPMLSQTVLLAGVNADPGTLAELFRALVAMRVKPYYLHHADLARGTGHFRTTIERGQAIVGALRGAVSGLCQPTYVLDIPGGHGKVPIGPGHARHDGEGSWAITDHRGLLHAYPEPGAPPLRTAGPDDVPMIEALIRDAFDPFTVRIGKPPGPMLRAYAPPVAAGEVAVLDEGREIVAALVRRPMPDHLYLDVVAVRPDRQGRGLGRWLIAAAEREAAMLGLPEVRLLTNAMMTENQRLYARLGYVETRRTEEDGYHRVFMTKALPL